MKNFCLLVAFSLAATAVFVIAPAPAEGAPSCVHPCIPAVAIGAGYYHACAVLSDGSVTCWGSNSYGMAAGYVGPVAATAVTAGAYHTCALLSDGSVMCWGDPSYGATVGYAGAVPATALASGQYYTCALLSDGSVTCWGSSTYGGATGYSGSVAATTVSARSDHTCSVLSDGSVTCWGYNYNGEAAPYTGSVSATDVGAGATHTCALLSDGSVTCWGANWGNQAAGYSGSVPASAVSAGAWHTCALLSDGSVTCWGQNSYGESAGYSGSRSAVAITSGGFNTCALLSDGAVACWGRNTSGESEGYGGATGGSAVPTGIKSCAVYNASNTPAPYPGQDLGVVIEYDPPGPDGDVAFCVGIITGATCPGGQPGALVNNMPTCVPDVCPQGMDPNTLTVCGTTPLCPSGVTSPPGAGEVIVVCGEAVSLCSLSESAPDDGWTVGALGVCVGLPWAEPGTAACPGSTVSVRVYWGTTPGLPPGGIFDLCL